MNAPGRRDLEFLPPHAGDFPEIDRLAGCPHPREMLSLAGQDRAEREIIDLIRIGRLHHAFLITGPEGIGKATFAYRVARFLLSEDERQGEGHGGALFEATDIASLAVSATSRAAHLVAGDAHPDLAILRRRYDPRTKKHRQEIAVEDTREAMGLFEKTAAFGGWRIVIIDAADDLNNASANAILKTLEEPPEKALFLIVAHQPQRLLPTIRSRCRTIALAPLGEDDLRRIGRAVTGTEPDGEALARAEGSVRRLVRLGDPATRALIGHVETVLKELPRRHQGGIERITDAVRSGAGAETALGDFLETLEIWLHRAIREAARPGALARADELSAFWSRMRRAAGETEALNLDRRALVITLMDDLAALVSGRAR